MATIVLQTVGTAVGAALGGPFGAAIGQAVGAAAGSYIDQQIFGPGDQTITGPRLESTQALSSREGSSIPRLYGRARIAGEIIWATQFEEVQSTETASQGGKGGGPKTTINTFSYFANFAIGLCEGEIGGIGKIWVDGKLTNNTRINFRLHRGSSSQLPDSLIEAKQDVGNAPAYRGLAYIVFESFPLEEYGNRIPQIAVEVIRPIGSVEKNLTAVNMIPGASEFGYDPEPVIETITPVEKREQNVHQTLAESDFQASLDELLATCPNLQQIALVVAWFGSDLRAGECEIRPKVETQSRNITTGENWKVASLSRGDALLVSQSNGAPAFGGTPSDNSILRAIQVIKDRGLRVTLNPFMLMDIPKNNTLPSPYGASKQNVYPWRGRITCHPARGENNSADRSALAATQLNSFIGTTQLEDISIGATGVVYNSQSDWSYRRMILHYVRLAQLAGGVDMFIIGSEMRGLTSVRDNNDDFPFVDALMDLATETKGVLGASCVVTYGADWSEYFGFQPENENGNVYYNLDKLWASPSLDAIGIDNYMPLSDWREGGDPGDVGRHGNDPKMLSSYVNSGEGHDWYYANDGDRNSGFRTPITDGLNKPWVYRYKDIKSWWSNQHYNRAGGVEASTPSPWVPQSKPIVFTEYGCPAIHNGQAQPNVFYDPKSSESALPWFSNGGRDDLAQYSYIKAHQHHWDDTLPMFKEGNNPASNNYNGRMIDFSKSQLWAWDARPYPTFPNRTDIWSDSENWFTGHWLNGRLGGVRLSELIANLLEENGVEEFDVSQVYGCFDGYVIAQVTSVRSALEVLVSLYNLSVYQDGGTLFFKSDGRDETTYISTDETVSRQGDALRIFKRGQETDIPSSATLFHFDPTKDFQQSDSHTSRINGGSLRQQTISAPIVADGERLKPILESWLHNRWTGRENVSFSIPKNRIYFTLGDEITFEDDEFSQRWRISAIDEGEMLTVSAVATEVGGERPTVLSPQPRIQIQRVSYSAPLVHFLDLPYLASTDDTKDSNLVAVTGVPWAGTHAIYSSPDEDGFSFVQPLENTAFMGVLTSPLIGTSITSRWNWSNAFELELYFGEISSSEMLHVLNGANVLAVRSGNGGWEVLQFQNADLIGPKKWKLSGLLRGQAGTEVEALSGAGSGTDVVVINKAVIPLENMTQQRGLLLNWLVGPAGYVLGDPEFARIQYAPGYRGLKPYSPVHLKVNQTLSGELVISWVRRNRFDSDDWSPPDVPMSEQHEGYLITITNAQGATLALEAFLQTLNVQSSDLVETFGNGQSNLNISVAQSSASVSWGHETKMNFTINL